MYIFSSITNRLTDKKCFLIDKENLHKKIRPPILITIKLFLKDFSNCKIDSPFKKIERDIKLYKTPSA